MNKKLSIFMVDDQPSITETYESLYKDYPGIKKLLFAHTEEEYWEVMTKHRKTIDVVVMDLMLDTAIPIAVRTETKVSFSGFSLMEKTLKKYRSTKFVVHSQFVHDTNILIAYRMGAMCYIAKHQESMDNFVAILKKVHTEGVVIPENYNRPVTNKIICYQDPKLKLLNDEELTIVDMLINEFETDDIRAATNSKSSFSINNKISGMLRTVGIPSRYALVRYALKAGMQPKDIS